MRGRERIRKVEMRREKEIRKGGVKKRLNETV